MQLYGRENPFRLELGQSLTDRMCWLEKKKKRKMKDNYCYATVTGIHFIAFSVLPELITLTFICKVLFLLGTGKPQPPTKTSSKIKCLIFPRCGANRMKTYHCLAQANPGFSRPVTTSIATAVTPYYVILFSLSVSQGSQGPRALTGIFWACSETRCELVPMQKYPC